MGGYTIKEYNGNKVWSLNDKLHREDGPAVEYADGSKAWWINGKVHREDGPAFEDAADGYKSWWINGVKLTKEEFIKKIKDKKFTANEIASLKSYGIEVG